MKLDIMLLQETHLIESDINDLKKEWNINYYIAGKSINSKGVAIRINNTFEFKMLNLNRDPDGRILAVTLEIAGLYTVTIINIYGPNQEDPLWFNNLFNPDYDLESDYVVFAGDWNVCYDEIDFYNYNTQRNLKNMEELKKGIKKLDLVDIWRLQNPSIKRELKNPSNLPGWTIF